MTVVKRGWFPRASLPIHWKPLIDCVTLGKLLWEPISISIDTGTLWIFLESVSVRGSFSTHSHHDCCLTDSDQKMPLTVF